MTPDTNHPQPYDLDRRLCVAPMLDWTDRHCRYFHRLLSRRAVLYTEMVTTGALLHAEPDRFLRFDPFEQPVALQLGGSDPAALAQCATMAERWGYSEVNLNVGCPSDRVQNGRFGACLMAEPQLVADCVAAMKEATTIPVTVKHRIGIDNLDSYELLHRFVATVANSGCTTFIVHARKAFLQGLSPKENRDVPPLRYDTVYRLKEDFPELEIVINGGIKTLNEARVHLEQVDGVMIGREAYQNPYLLAEVDRDIYGATHEPPSRQQVLEDLYPYIEAQLAEGARLSWIARHILCLFQGQPGARRFRRHISENAFKDGAGLNVLKEAAALINPRVTDAA
ncbi:tRNA dihydrouridine(20/20a) synthase DusA [Motiliproteus sp. SC1-56]|uniref:tRNA dihydrouridine(20/20a) synthase DusA n=1 Tax=Motiliproteus sp. SC1-56 TaxID=2799565 RepID=UPI001A8D9F4B|nr:tRNA dihydrouridine(20/20a) synthase DusA [Motiliproteus sp. SC1-56]